MYSNGDQGRVYQNCTFHDYGAGVLLLGRGRISHIMKMHYFFKNLPVYSQTWIRQTQFTLMMTKELSTKILPFDPGARDLVLGHDRISHILKMHYFFKNLL